MKDLTFGGYPLEVSFLEGATIIKCKGVTGTLNQMELFLNGKSHEVFFFGQARILRGQGGLVKIDCLSDNMEHVKETFIKIKKQQEKNG